MEHLKIGDADIEYEVQGSGEPVLLIEVGLIADGVGRPLMSQPELASQFRLIHYRRRGYKGSILGSEPPTIPRQATDAAALLRHLEVKPAHTVGTPLVG